MAKTPKLTDSKARTAERQSRFRARRKVEKLAAEQSAGARYSAPGKLEELADTISIVAYNSLAFGAENPHDRRFSGPCGRAARAAGIEARLTAHSGRVGLASELTARGAVAKYL